MHPDLLRRIIERCRRDPKFFHALVHDPESVFAELEKLGADRRAKASLLWFTPAQVIGMLLGKPGPYGARGGVVYTCGDRTCCGTCGDRTCERTCCSLTCFNTCEDSCGVTCTCVSCFDTCGGQSCTATMVNTLGAGSGFAGGGYGWGQEYRQTEPEMPDVKPKQRPPRKTTGRKGRKTSL